MVGFLFKRGYQQKVRDWFADYAMPLKLFFISRIGLFVLVFFSLVAIPQVYSPTPWRGLPENLFLDGWSRWDSGWYMQISEYGYTNTPNLFAQDTAVFPMYPILVNLFNRIIHDTHTAMILISNISFGLALIVLFKLLSLRYDPEITKRTLVLICVSPFSFFFSAGYSESVFLLSIVCSFYFCEQKRYFWAACWAAVAGATRFIGLIIVVPLLLLYFGHCEYNWRKIRPNILVFLISFLGIISYMVFLGLKFGNPLQFFESQGMWGAFTPIKFLADTFSSLSYHSFMGGHFLGMALVHSLATFGAVLIAIAYCKRVGLAYTVFSILSIVVCLTRMVSMGRLLIVVFPLFVAMAFFLRNKTLYFSFLYLNILFLALFSIMFSHWSWVS